MIVQPSPGRTDVISSAFTQILLLAPPAISNVTNRAIPLSLSPAARNRTAHSMFSLNITTMFHKGAIERHNQHCTRYAHLQINALRRQTPMKPNDRNDFRFGLETE